MRNTAASSCLCNGTAEGASPHTKKSVSCDTPCLLQLTDLRGHPIFILSHFVLRIKMVCPSGTKKQQSPYFKQINLMKYGLCCLLLFGGGGEGSRTPVQNNFLCAFSECSLFCYIPAGNRQPTETFALYYPPAPRLMPALSA